MEYDFEKLSKEIVTVNLHRVKGAPVRAGGLARQIIVAAVAGTQVCQAPGATVASVCRGVMSGMMLLDLDLPKTAVALLMQMPFVAREANLDLDDCMIWAMEGIVPVAWMAPTAVADDIRRGIEANFMECGEAFNKIVCTIGSGSETR